MIAPLLTLLLLAQPAPDPAGPAPTTPPSAAPAAAEAAPNPDPAPLGLTLRVLPDAPTGDAAGLSAPDPERPLEVRLADPLVLELVVETAPDTELFIPMLPAVGTFELVGPRPGTEKVAAGKKTVTWRWAILPVRLGVEKIPAIEIPYRTATGLEGSSSTAPLRVYVRGHLENDNDPQLGSAPPPVDVITTNWALIWGLSVGGAIVFAALATWLVLLGLRQRFEALRPPPPPRPAIEVALERLDAIDGRSALELDGAQRLAETIDTLRDYLGRRYGIDALEMTTRELEATLPGLDLKGVDAREIGLLLADADLVKFARLMPDEAEARRPSAVVRKIVTDTWEPPKVEVEVHERAEPASMKQRFWAGLIDLVLFGALALALFGGLWIAGAMAWGWTALALLGVLLALRDLFGRSPGKRLLRLAVVHRDELQSRPELGPRLTRNALLLLWPLALPLEWLVLRQHPLGLRLGDLLADTEVVRDRGPLGPAPTAPSTEVSP